MERTSKMYGGGVWPFSGMDKVGHLYGGICPLHDKKYCMRLHME